MAAAENQDIGNPKELSKSDGSKDETYATSSHPAQPVLAPVSLIPTHRGPFPLEIRQLIVEYSSHSGIQSLAILMLVSKEWCATIKNDECGWKRKAKSLYIQRS